MYKQSIFNSVIQISNDRYLIYNAMTDKYCFLNKGQLRLYHLYNENSDSKLFEQLLREGFIVQSDADEITALISNLNSIDSNKEILQLIINPTMDCNLRCWYCYENHVKGSRIQPWIKEAIIKLLHNEIENNHQLKAISISFFGGEPFLFFDKDVYPIMLSARKLCNQKGLNLSFSFTSNGVLISPRIQEKLNQIGNCCFQITLDGSKRFHDLVRIHQNGKGSFNIIMSNIIELLSKRFHVTIRINLTKDNIDFILDLVPDLLRIPQRFREFCRIDFQKVWQEQISEASLNRMQELAAVLRSKYSFHTTYLHRHRIYSPCYAESEYEALINYNGEVFKCSARDFISENKDGILSTNGKIIWNQKKKNDRKRSLLKKPICRKCRIAPLCGGGCAQLRIESTSDQCTYGYTDEDIDDLILSRFENLYIKTL